MSRIGSPDSEHDSFNSRYNQLEQSWAENSPICIEDLLTDIPDSLRCKLINELIEIEVGWRRKNGEQPQPADYVKRFPECQIEWKEVSTDASMLDVNEQALIDHSPPSPRKRTNLKSGSPGFAQSDSTSISLLRRLRLPNQEVAWRRFVDLYAPLIFYWGGRQGLKGTDASDLVQDVMAILVVKLPEFEYDPKQRFRGWLRTVTLNTARNFQRRDSARPVTGHHDTLDRIQVADDVSLFEEAEYRSFLVNRALKLMQTEFQEQTWKACWKHVAEGRTAADVAQELNISANSVHIAKSRVMRCLREELEGLMES